MKKYLLIIFTAIVGMFLSSCVEKEIVTFHPGDLVAPVLSNLTQAEYTLTDGGTFDDFTFTEASVGLSASIQYEVFAILPLDGATPKSLGKVTNAETITVNANTLNNVLIGLECAPDTPVAVNFFVTANWMSNSSKALGIATSSNIISANITPFKAEKTYKSIYFRGGFNGWGASESYRLFCYAEDDNTYEGTVNFDADGKIADHIAQGFKFADADWGDINYGSSDTEAEAASVTLVSGGDNITVYTAHKYYSFKVDLAGLKATKLYGFDKMGVIGLNGDWDNDIDMTYNPYYGRFYADVTASAATTFKFRLDGAWDTNWGVNGEKGGADIPIESGSYRIYFYFSNASAPTYEISADMYGKDEPTEPVEPDPPADPVWAVIGEVGGTSWDTDFAMTDNGDGTWSTIVSVEGGFKVRYNGSWADADVRGAGSEGFIAEDGVAFPAVSPGNNIAVTAAGTYEVVYDSANETIKVTNMGNRWSLIGEIGGSSWDKDFFMTKGDDNKWVSDVVNITGGFKVRYNISWDDANVRGAKTADFTFETGTAFDVEGPGNNITAPEAADYIVTYDPATETVVVNAALPENQWSLIGEINGASWNKDFYMLQTTYGAWISDSVSISGGFKIRFNNSWDDANTRGAKVANFVFTKGVAFETEGPGNNIAAPAEAKYAVSYNPNAEKAVAVPSDDNWAVIGDVEGTGWGRDFYMAETSTDVWESDYLYVEKDKGFKIRFDSDWAKGDMGNSVEDAFTVGTPITLAAGGKNITSPANAVYKVKYDKTAGTILVTSAWSLIGVINGDSWTKDVYMYETAAGIWESPVVNISGEFKIRYASSWADADTRGATTSGYVCTSGVAFTVEGPGNNIAVPSAGNYQVVYNANTNSVTITAK